MKVLFDITHPAQVHFFKHVIRMLAGAGHDVLVTARDKDITIDLLDSLNIQHTCISRMGRGRLGKIGEMVKRNILLIGISRRFRPDVMVARTGISVSPVAALLGVPSLIFEDTEHSRVEMMMGPRLAKWVCTGTGYLKDHGARQIRYRGIPQLGYLMPKYFQPDMEVLRRHGVEEDKPFIVLRRVSWQAYHDVGLSGAREKAVFEAVTRLSRFGRVLITSENALSASLSNFKCPVPVEHMHSLLAFASLYIGEGGTMAAEAAALGTPSVFCSHLRTGYLLALEKEYGLVCNTDSLADGVKKAEDILIRPDTKRLWGQRREKLLADSEDIVEFICRTVIQIGSPKSGIGAAGG